MLRLIDANLNRAREGLRVLEDVARFTLEDGELAGALRTLRHRLGASAGGVTQAGLEARRAETDVGAAGRLGHTQRATTEELVLANARRAQEALRVLEETVALAPGIDLPPAYMAEARFALYDLERRLIAGVTRGPQRARLRGLYVLLDVALLGPRPLEAVTEAVLAAGARVLQLRDKTSSKGLMLERARSMVALCRAAGAVSIVNDHVDVALAAGADGVHLGPHDLPAREARRLLETRQLLGVSTNDPEEAERARAAGADYVAVGCLFATTTKRDTRPATLATLAAVRAAVDLPIAGIGGVNAERLPSVVAAGAEMVAVSSAVLRSADPTAAARRLLAAWPETPLQSPATPAAS